MNGVWRNICQDDCFIAYKSVNKIENATYQEISETTDFGSSDNGNCVRKCSQCHGLIRGEDKNLSWETMDYCNEECLGLSEILSYVYYITNALSQNLLNLKNV